MSVVSRANQFIVTSPVAKKRSIDQPIGTHALWNYHDWLRVPSQSEHRAKERYGNLAFFQNTWSTIYWRVIMGWLPSDTHTHTQKNCLPSFKGCELKIQSSSWDIRSDSARLKERDKGENCPEYSRSVIVTWLSKSFDWLPKAMKVELIWQKPRQRADEKEYMSHMTVSQPQPSTFISYTSRILSIYSHTWTEYSEHLEVRETFPQQFVCLYQQAVHSQRGSDIQQRSRDGLGSQEEADAQRAERSSPTHEDSPCVRAARHSCLHQFQTHQGRAHIFTVFVTLNTDELHFELLLCDWFPLSNLWRFNTQQLSYHCAAQQHHICFPLMMHLCSKFDIFERNQSGGQRQKYKICFCLWQKI